MTSQKHEEQQYLDLIKRVVETGSIENTRNGDTKCVFGASMRFSLCNGTIPLLTSKRVAWKTCFRELMWFLKGDTDNRNLQVQHVHIWDGNSTREFLDLQGLHEYPEGILGPIYGWQWRRWNVPYKYGHDKSMDESGNNHDNGTGIVDQIANIINILKDPDPSKRASRRLIVSAWNPSQLHEMALPPCHVLFQFHVREGKYLSCALYQRSGDIGLGVPFNIASYSFLTHLMAHHCGLVAEEFVYFLGNAHIYDCHMDALRKQLSREQDLMEFPRIFIKTVKSNIEDYDVEDVEWITEYKCHDTISMPFVA